MCGIFGGQGTNNLTALDDVRHLNQSHAPVLTTLLSNSVQTILELASRPHARSFHEDLGFDLRTWLDSPDRAPATEYLGLSPISFPINTLLSLSQYCILCNALGLHPGQLRQLLRGVSGHSQGLFAAVAVAKSDSWDTFYQACDEALRISFFVGLASHIAAPACTISAAAAADCIDHHEGFPSPMLSIAGLDKQQIIQLVERTNQSLKDTRQTVHLALANSRDRFILAGPPSCLRSVCVWLREIKAPDTLDQTRILSHRRKPTVDVQFLPISAPYHTPHLTGIDAQVWEWTAEVALTGCDLGIPVYHTSTGQNLQELRSADLLNVLVRAVTVEPVHWALVVQRLVADGATHVLDFGPGQIGSLVQDLTDGTGLRVVQISDHAGSRGVTGRAELLAAEMPAPAPNWKQLFGPRLVTDEWGTVRVETKMTRLFGTPPVMVAGMTPTTVPWDFVATIMRAGYHVEIAGGGYWSEKKFESALRSIAATVPPERAITCNLLYASPQTIAWQIGMLRRLAGDGVPIDGITIGAGIPSPEIVKEYVESIPGLRHISFKPGSLAAIHQVISIAQENPDFPIGLQWTGGRAGGHHSWEDFHQPMLATYGKIRRCSNIVLIAGSGFGGGEDTLPFLTGEWALEFGYPCMPFDGVLLGSRMMVAKEAHTSLQAKELIIKAEGVDDAEWHGSFDKPTGGVITVESEMGQPIHVLATRGMMLWKEFDQTIFSIRDKAKRLEHLRLHRDEVVDRLNRDFFRPWFAVDGHGESIELADMTYGEVLRRLCRLMFVHDQNRWIDETYRTRVHDFLQLSHERFGCPNWTSPKEHRPDVLIRQFEQSLSSKADEMLYAEDISLLLASFRRPDLKPVPFIPQLDEHFATWFKKDSLWQSEDVDAVEGRDADRVCIIQGPVAVRHSKTHELSAKDILDSICEMHIQALRKKGLEVELNPERGSLASWRGTVRGVRVSLNASTTQYEFLEDYQSAENGVLIKHITEAAGPWAVACLENNWLFRGGRRLENPVKAAFCPVAGDIVEIRRRDSESIPDDIAVVTQGVGSSKLHCVLGLSLEDHACVRVTLAPRTPSPDQNPTAQFLLELRPRPNGFTIFEHDRAHLDSVKALYTQLWINEPMPKVAGLSSEFCGGEVVLSQQHVNDYLKVISQSNPSSIQGWNPTGSVPIDYCVVVAWEALTKPLMLPSLGCDLLQLLHGSIRFQYATAAKPLQFGNAVSTFSRITALNVKPTGTLIRVSADIRRQGKRVVRIEAEFFIRGSTGSLEQFNSIEEPEFVVNVTSPVVNALLVSRKWLLFEEHSPDLVGKKLSFKLTTHTMFGNDGSIALLQVSGIVTLVDCGNTTLPAIRLGRVYFEEESCSGNPVMDFLRRQGTPRVVRQELSHTGWAGPSSIVLTAPTQSFAYSAVSRDTNPIHTCPVFARYAGLDGTVIHGMHTSAIVRRAVEWALGDADRTRFRGWHASFEAMVRPGDRLRVEMQHIAMESGRMVIRVEAFNDESAEKVLDGEAMVEQPPTGYVFCGQGSQEKGMGMSLYASIPEAKALWDRAETYFRESYGDMPRRLV